jgi:hypothetical protein
VVSTKRTPAGLSFHELALYGTAEACLFEGLHSTVT